MSETFNKKYSEKCRSLILGYAEFHPEFRKKLNQLSQFQEQLLYPDFSTYTQLMGQAMELINEISSDCGLFEFINLSNLSNEQFQEFLWWMLEKSSELSYYVEERARQQQPKSINRPLLEKVDVFLSWSIRTPRERTAMLGVRDGLDYFGVKYYDFTEHRADSSRDETEKIEAKICEAVNQSICSIELTSNEFQGHWIDFERRQLRKKENIVRIIIHLDKEIGIYANDEFRILRLDFSDGRYRIHRTDDQSWINRASDASYYQSQEYLSRCYALGHLVREICNKKEPIKIINSLQSAQSASPEKLSFPIKPVGFEETHRLLNQYNPANAVRITPESRHEAVHPISCMVRIVFASIVGITGYFITASYFAAIVLAVIVFVYFDNIIALFLPKYSTKDELISTMAAITTADVLYLITLFIQPVREFIAYQGALVLYGIPIILGILTLLVFIRTVQLRNKQSSSVESDLSRIGLATPEQVQRIVNDIEEGKNCEVARLDDLFFLVPRDWEYRKVKTGHWELKPANIGYFFITVLFLNTGGKDSANDLMREVEDKAQERRWTFLAKNLRKINEEVDAIDVITLARNGVIHRLVNFCYNGLEYFVDVKSMSLEEIKQSMPILDAWIGSFELREH